MKRVTCPTCDGDGCWRCRNSGVVSDHTGFALTPEEEDRETYEADQYENEDPFYEQAVHDLEQYGGY